MFLSVLTCEICTCVRAHCSSCLCLLCVDLCCNLCVCDVVVVGLRCGGCFVVYVCDFFTLGVFVLSMCNKYSI